MYPKLCYIDKYGIAYFTTALLKDQRGDDWDDAPYEHNAGEPYTWLPIYEKRGVPAYEIVEVHFDKGSLLEPRDGHLNSPYSVDQINERAIPWLRSAPGESKNEVWAEASIEGFKESVWAAGGFWRTEHKPE